MNVPDDQPICHKHAKKLTKKIALLASKYALTCSECKELIMLKQTEKKR